MLLDVALVTQTLTSLIQKHVTASPEAGKVTPLSVSPLPPDKLTGDHAIGLYLYHIVEDPQYKNLPPLSDEEPPVRYTPMGLNLHYLLTAHSDSLGATGVENEQTMMGLAMKALHDYPVIDDTTDIGGKVFPVALQGTDNRFRVVLQPLQHSEAMTYWTAGNQPLRLAAYYQVSVVLLEPEPTRSRRGRVLTYGVFAFTRGGPRLDGSKSTVTFTVPGEATPRTVEVQPAQASITDHITFFGSGLVGDQTTLLLKHRRFPQPIEVGATWGVVARDSEIFAVVQPMADTFTIVPGMYSAIVKVTERRLMPDRTFRVFVKTSNETPFVVAPRITSILPPDGLLRVAVQGGVFQDATGISADAVELFVGPQRVPLKAAATLNPGEFEVVDASTVRFRYPVPGVLSGAVVPLRLIVNGAESAPHWVTVP